QLSWASVQAALPGSHFRGMIAPNNSFKPNALRYTNNMAGRACHVVGSATHVGLTQALGASNLELERFMASVASHGHSTPVVAGFGPPASVTFWAAHSSVATVRSSA